MSKGEMNPEVIIDKYKVLYASVEALSDYPTSSSHTGEEITDDDQD
jgi:hypothetical protein